MNTHRQRREARAERLREWAAKREAKAEADVAQARQMGSTIPLGQPILAGHHSQRRDERYRERIGRTMDRGIEHQRKAEQMASRADTIEAQLAESIYDDDPDALDRLRDKLDRLQAKRKRYTDYNASCRRAHKADPTSTHGDLSILDPAQRQDLAALARFGSLRPGGAFPPYATSNLSGQLSKLRERIARLERGQGSPS
ncbi:MAG TPA: DUF3560 domain-containing protein [Nocardioidaceae bacterium]|nr:DUF3560 domain-containing protein [Nocardioidaceae bacterium]